MSLEAALRSHGATLDSPPSSGRSSPVPRATRRTVEDGLYRADKSLKRYAANIERALASWEIAPEEWADYIAFLGRLLKAIQTHPKDAPILPHNNAIATRLAQCLNPALPSGVHQKALEVYTYVFATFGHDHIAAHLHEYLPGLSAVLSFASLTVRPGLYALFEDHIISLSASDLRPALKSLILGLLPALEEENSEDFERAFAILQAISSSFMPPPESRFPMKDLDGYFWQCLFLAIITSPSRRQGALNFLSRKLPRLITGSSDQQLTPEAACVVSPEPGLLVRCFVCGLCDPQMLIQRGFLDLLVTHLPLNSVLLQQKIADDDLDKLVFAATQVLLRRDMSLNRRLWSWFLGPEPKEKSDPNQAISPTLQRKATQEYGTSIQLHYFSTNGKASLQRSILKMFTESGDEPSQRARPFRICLSLMDRWEIGGLLVPQIFLPAMRSLYEYSLTASTNDVTEVIRSASLFFDGVEASLIWESLIAVVRDGFEGRLQTRSALQLVRWISEHFNLQDEEMLMAHIPYAALFLLCSLDSSPQLGMNGTDTISIASLLLEKVPGRALMGSGSPSASGHFQGESSDLQSVSRAILAFYKDEEGAGKSRPLLTADQISHLLYTATVSVLVKSLSILDPGIFSQCTTFFLLLLSKSNISGHLKSPELRESFFNNFLQKSSADVTVPFQILSSAITLIATLASKDSGSSIFGRSDILELEPRLSYQLWKYMSLEKSKYHVEAVKSFWQLEEFASSDAILIASLCGLVRGVAGAHHRNEIDQMEALRRFTVLWGHTIVPGSSKIGSGRRGSGMSVLTDAKQQRRAQHVLEQPALLVLDVLTTPSDPAFDIVRTWIQGLPSLEQLFHMLFTRLGRLLASALQSTPDMSVGVARRQAQSIQDLDYILGHIQHVLQHGGLWGWQCINGILLQESQNSADRSAFTSLADTCAQILFHEQQSSVALNHRAVNVLELLVTSPIAAELRQLELDSILLEKLVICVQSNFDSLQGGILRLVQLTLKLRLTPPVPEQPTRNRTRSISLKRPSMTLESRPTTSASSTGPPLTPPIQLFRCLQLGFSSQSTRYHLDKWLAFLAEILPTFSDAIFTNLLPLVECFAQQLSLVHEQMVRLSRKSEDGPPAVAPEAVSMGLLDGLEMVLDRAYECLMNESTTEMSNRENEPKPSFLSNVTSGVFKAEGPPSRMLKSNSRLTVILALQDSIRISLQMWLWASGSTGNTNLDSTSSATAAYNALKVRNKTRHLLEQIFSVEPLESLEVIIAHWGNAQSDAEASSALRLLHVMHVSRPKNVVPATLNALCSRTNPTAIPTTHNSSLTLDLSPPDVATFFSAYLDSTEDDAIDEVWPDCITFLRDVLANPLPYRQVLPHLLSITLLLAEKLSNTNFGEQRKMRRDLGDIFQRLLTATFTTLPSGYIAELGTEDSLQNAERAPRRSVIEHSMTLLAVLNRVTARLDLILESSERIAAAINNTTTSLLAPTFRARSFPKNVNQDLLEVIVQMIRKAPAAKLWKKELGDAFYDTKFLVSPSDLMVAGWFPVLHQWSLYDKERMPELLSRLAAPSTAGIMFGVGASAARLEADRKTQYNLRRICLLLLASPKDTYVTHLRPLEEKLAELFEADPSSSPSAAIKPELFMLCRTLILSVGPLHLSPVWPIINDKLQAAIMSLLPNSQSANEFSNLSLFQACKLLDLLVALSPDEFQLHEWLYITDTIDAVYQPAGWTPSALSDQVAEAVASVHAEHEETDSTSQTTDRRRTLLGDNISIDKDDIKALPKEDFVRAVLWPFLSQLSLHAYEGVYSMDVPDIESLKSNLLKDLLDIGTIVE